MKLLKQISFAVFATAIFMSAPSALADNCDKEKSSCTDKKEGSDKKGCGSKKDC